MDNPVIFDGHNDALLRLWKDGCDGVEDRFRNAEKGHVTLERAAAGGMAGGFFAMFAPPQGKFAMPNFKAPYDVALPDMLPAAEALPIILGQAAVAARLEDSGLLKLCRSRTEIDEAISAGTMAAILHMEGAEAIDADLSMLDVLYGQGLRSIGPVWSRPTIFGYGVPFRFPSDADIGPGLTDLGKKLVARCAELRIVVDTSHLNMAGFRDVGDSGLPLVATHSNAHAICPGARNLTDAQLRAIGETGGMVGLNFGTMFLHPDGSARAEGALDHAIRHLAHMIEMAGEDHVGLGSDFDGAPMPDRLQSAAELPNLVDAMRAAGFGKDLIARICSGNWLAFLSRGLPDSE